jgi:hypothetical protein
MDPQLWKKHLQVSGSKGKKRAQTSGSGPGRPVHAGQAVRTGEQLRAGGRRGGGAPGLRPSSRNQSRRQGYILAVGTEV